MRKDRITHRTPNGQRRRRAFDLGLAGVLAVWAAWTPPALAEGLGDLTLTPTRVVFEGRMRTAQVSLVNRGTAATTYRVTFIQKRMHEDGHFEELAEPGPGQRFADRLIRYSPRQVVLGPGESQTVRLMLRKPADLAAGEYRSHLLFQAVPPEEAGIDVESLELGSDEIGIRLMPIFRITIPVIVRHGELEASARLAEVSLERGAEENVAPVLALSLERRGSRSLCGDLTVTWIPEDGTPAAVVGEVKGFAVYASSTVRNVRLPLHTPGGAALSGGRLEVAFSEEPGTADGAHAALVIPLS